MFECNAFASIRANPRTRRRERDESLFIDHFIGFAFASAAGGASSVFQRVVSSVLRGCFKISLKTETKLATEQ